MPLPIAKPQPVAPAEPEFPSGYWGDAQRACYRSRNDDACRFLCAALLTSDDPELWKKVRWCEALKRPVVGIRWGLALQSSDPDAQAGGGGSVADLSRLTGEFGPQLLKLLPDTGIERVLMTNSPAPPPVSGVQFLGVGGDQKEVLSLAEERGVDMLLIATLLPRAQSRGRDAGLSVSLRILQVPTAERLFASRPVISRARTGRTSRDADPLAELLREMGEYLETNFHLDAQPALTKEQARLHAETLAREEGDDPLPVLMAIRYFQHRELLDRLDAELCYQRLLQYELGAKMASGTPEQRKQIIAPLVPRR